MYCNYLLRVEYPYIVLLISGGHCILAVVRGVDDFLMLGRGLDGAPGEAYDKVLDMRITTCKICKSCISTATIYNDMPYNYVPTRLPGV